MTRPDGGYELLVDEPGTYMVNVTSADGRIDYPMRTLEVPDADATTADFVFGSVLVSGQVVDAESAAPVPADVFAAPSSVTTAARPLRWRAPTATSSSRWIQASSKWARGPRATRRPGRR